MQDTRKGLTMRLLNNTHPMLSSDEFVNGTWRFGKIPPKGSVSLIFHRADNVQVIRTTFATAKEQIANMDALGFVIDGAVVHTNEGNLSIMHIVDKKPRYVFPVTMVR